MRKFFWAAALFVSICFASCGNQTSTDVATDSTTVDTVDTITADSDSIVCGITQDYVDSLEAGLVK